MKRLLINNRGTTLMELMVALAILSLGITALLQTLQGGIRYASDTENNIKAINIAREGIEAVINIRDTNWLRFPSDKYNCWNVDKYSNTCIGAPSPPVIASGSYTVYSDNGLWYMSGITSPSSYVGASWSSYKSQFRVGIDANGFFTQTGIAATPCSSTTQSGCVTNFTREIQFYPTPIGSTGSVLVRSITRWNLERPRSVILETTLTNWKSNF